MADGLRAGVVSAPGGVALAYVEAGDPAGDPILFLHGLGHSSRSFARQLEDPALAGHRLVAIDLRGHGASGWAPDDAFAAATWAGDVAAVLDALALDRVTVVAWSYAGLVLADYLAAHGIDRLRALNLVAAAVRAGFPEAYADFGSGALPDGFLSDDPETSRAADALFVRESEGVTGFPPEEVAELRGIVGGTPREVLRRLLARSVDNAALWAGVRLPVLLSHGTGDRINLPVISERQAVTIPGVRLSRYEGAGHLPFREDPGRFGRELLELLARS